MEKRNKIIIGALIVIIAILVALIAYHELVPQEKPDEVVKIGKITFNITNNTNTSTKFRLVDKSVGWKRYYENTTGFDHNVAIHNFNKMSQFEKKVVLNARDTQQMKSPCQTVNGVAVYTVSSTEGKAGTPMYESFVENTEKNMLVRFTSLDANETAKMVLSLKFAE